MFFPKTFAKMVADLAFARGDVFFVGRVGHRFQ